MYNIITPLARFENFIKLKEMLEPKKITWHVLIDDDSSIDIKIQNSWIKKYTCPNSGRAFFERCNASINWFIDTQEIKDDEMYCILNDDDAYEPEFFNKLTNNDILITSMERGFRIPPTATGPRAHPTTKLWATPEYMKIGYVGVEQIVLKGSILKKYRLPLNVCGDGMMITQIVRENEVKYIPEANVWFNYFEPGRWYD